MNKSMITSASGAPASASTMTIHIRGMKRRDVMILTTLLSSWSARSHFDADIALTGGGVSCCLHGRTAAGPVHIPAERILYLTSDGHYVQAVVHPQKDSSCTRAIRLALTFREAREQLQDPRFLGCGRGIVLNMNCVLRQEHGVFLMQDGTVFPLPSHRKRETAAAYRAYLQSLSSV